MAEFSAESCYHNFNHHNYYKALISVGSMRDSPSIIYMPCIVYPQDSGKIPKYSGQCTVMVGVDCTDQNSISDVADKLKESMLESLLQTESVVEGHGGVTYNPNMNIDDSASDHLMAHMFMGPTGRVFRREIKKSGFEHLKYDVVLHIFEVKKDYHYKKK